MPGARLHARAPSEQEVAADGKPECDVSTFADPLAAMEVRHEPEQIDARGDDEAEALEDEEVQRTSTPPRRRRRGRRADRRAPARAGARAGFLLARSISSRRITAVMTSSDPEQPRKSLGPERIADLQAGQLLGRLEIDARQDKSAHEDHSVGHANFSSPLVAAPVGRARLDSWFRDGVRASPRASQHLTEECRGCDVVPAASAKRARVALHGGIDASPFARPSSRTRAENVSP